MSDTIKKWSVDEDWRDGGAHQVIDENGLTVCFVAVSDVESDLEIAKRIANVPTLEAKNAALVAQVDNLRAALKTISDGNFEPPTLQFVSESQLMREFARRTLALALTPDTPEEETKYRLFVQQLDAYQVNEIIDLVTKHYKNDIGREACQEELTEFFNRSVLPMPEAAREREQKRDAVIEAQCTHDFGMLGICVICGEDERSLRAVEGK